MLDITVRRLLGTTLIDVTFTTERPSTALFGPSGAGKTSVLNMTAGLLRPERGRVVVGGEMLSDTDRGVFVPVHKRRIGYVFQESRLFPHLSVRSNLLYGRWMNRLAQDEAEERRVIGMLDIGGLLGRRPETLSGG